MTETKRLGFDDWIAGHARGTLNEEATAALGELVSAVSDLKKKGTLTIEITVEPTGTSGRMVMVGARVKTKVPQPDAELSVRYVGDGGTLHRDDPYQQRLPVGQPDEDEVQA
jgi:hypothetical protein